MALPVFPMAHFQNWKTLLCFQCRLSGFYGSDMLRFIGIHELSYQLLELHIFHRVLGCLGVTLTKRSIDMSLCMSINVFLLMLAYANHLCNLPVGNPAELVTFAKSGQGLSPAVGKVACLLQAEFRV